MFRNNKYILLLILTFLCMFKNQIKGYLIIANIIITIFPGSYLINIIVSMTTYSKYLCYLSHNNRIIYKNLNFISDLNSGYIIISNHVNVTDVNLIRTKIDCHVVGKHSLISKEYPYLNIINNIFFKNLKIIPYKRNSIKSGVIIKKKILELISKKMNVLIFPEGTSQKNCHNGILTFKKGLFHLAYKYNIKILPVVLYYTDKNYGLDKKTVFSPSYILKNNSTIYVNFLNPFEPQNYLNTDNLVDTVYNKMNSIIKDYNDKISETN